MELLLRKGASTEAMNGYNNTPLHLAAWSGHTGLMELLLDKGASSIEAINKSNNTPLYHAADNPLHNTKSAIGLLLNKVASIEAMRGNNTRVTVLHCILQHRVIRM